MHMSNQEDKPESRFSSQHNFASVGPSPVHVTGVNGENLGAGRLIGILHRTLQKNARVISVDEPDSASGCIELLEAECHYGPLDDAALSRISATELLSPLEYLAKGMHRGIKPPSSE